ncbi:MAG: hypothetical protein R2754_14755 [Microthrixaceae bacterium]
MQEPTPTDESTQPASWRRRGALGAAVFGVAAAGLMGLGALTAGAQDDTGAPAGVAVADEPAADAPAPEEGPSEADEAQFEKFEACLDEQLGELAPEGDEEPTDAQLEELDAKFEAAEQACEGELPEGVLEMDEAMEAEFAEFEQCLDDTLGAEPAGSEVVVVSGDDTEQVVQFGDEPGTVTITGTKDGVETNVEGGATSVDVDEMDQAFEAAEQKCESLLPEGVEQLEDGGFEVGAENPPAPAPEEGDDG